LQHTTVQSLRYYAIVQSLTFDDEALKIIFPVAQNYDNFTDSAAVQVYVASYL